MEQDCGASSTVNCEEKMQSEVTLSKNQLKKQRKREKWLTIKQDRRRHSKENRKRRLAEMREKGEDLGPTRKSLKLNKMKNSSCKIKVVLDLSFDEYMTEKDVNSLTCQLQHSYSANRRAENPLQLYICSLSGKTKQRLDEIGDYKGWDIHKETQHYEQVFPKESLVYLSSESPNILTTLSEDKVYIIGGLVDHNSHKGLCQKIAEEKGIAHAQLPIAEYLEMKSRKVLAVNHVFSILLKYTETYDWKAAFLAEMPQRKQAHAKEDIAGSSESSIADSKEHKDHMTEEYSSRSISKSHSTEVNEGQDLKSNFYTNNLSTEKNKELADCKEDTNLATIEYCKQDSSIKTDSFSENTAVKVEEVQNNDNLRVNEDQETGT